VLRREGEGMVDPIGIAARRHHVSILRRISKRWGEGETYSAPRYRAYAEDRQRRVNASP
jgi:hypothetical protein